MSKLPDVPLADAPQLLQFLQATLDQLESASGGIDEEARAALAKLQGVAAYSPAVNKEAASSMANMGEEHLAAHLAKLESQMAAIESALAQSSPETQALMADSTAVWAGKDGTVGRKDQE